MARELKAGRRANCLMLRDLKATIGTANSF